MSRREWVPDCVLLSPLVRRVSVRGRISDLIVGGVRKPSTDDRRGGTRVEMWIINKIRNVVGVTLGSYTRDGP